MKKTIVIVSDLATIGGGAYKVAIKSAIELAKDKDYQVIFFAANGKIDEELKNNTSIKTYCISTKHIAQNPKKIEAMRYGIWNKSAAHEFEKVLSKLDSRNTVVHVHSWTKALSVSVIATATKMNFNVIITLHDYFSVCPNGGFYNYRTKDICKIKPMSMKCIMCNCDKRLYIHKIWRCIRQKKQNQYISNNDKINYIYISNRILNLSKPYIKSDSFYFLQNPIDLANKMSLNHEKSNRFICVGRVSEEKGVEDFCKAITIAQKKLDIVGQVIGSGPILEQLKSQYPNIEFLGWVNSEDMAVYYKNARALVFPSVCNEGSPLTIPEALSYGLPCVVTDCTSAVDMIEDGKTGLIYKAQNVDELVSKLDLLSSDEKLSKFQQNIYLSFNPEDYSYTTHINNLKKIYDNILGKVQ